MCTQLWNYFDNIPSKFQCGFRKGYSPQHNLLLMIDKWKKDIDSNNVFGAVLTDLSLHIIFACLKTNKGLPSK